MPLVEAKGILKEQGRDWGAVMLLVAGWTVALVKATSAVGAAAAGLEAEVRVAGTVVVSVDVGWGILMRVVGKDALVVAVVVSVAVVMVMAMAVSVVGKGVDIAPRKPRNDPSLGKRY